MLTWTGDIGFEVDRVEPASVNTDTNFEFRVRYYQDDNIAPLIKSVWIDINDNDTCGGIEQFEMSATDTTDTIYSGGKDYKVDSLSILYKIKTWTDPNN